MDLRPLGSRVIIRPTPPETVSEGGIVFADNAGVTPAMTGTVVSVGRGPASAQRLRQTVIDRCRAILSQAVDVCEDDSRAALDRRLRAYAEAVDALSEVQIGDFVAFPYTAGTNMTVDGQPYVVIEEADLQAVWTPDEKASAA